MKTRFLIPVLAAIFAMGMSFTTANQEMDPANDYIQLNNGTWFKISEQDCGVGSSPCRAKLTPNGQEYQVYNAQNTSSPKSGNGQVIELY